MTETTVRLLSGALGISEHAARLMLEPEPIADFPGFINHLLDKGYSRNRCLPGCPDRDGAEHEHLRNPRGEDVIIWADGRVSGYDLTQPARLIYPGR